MLRTVQHNLISMPLHGNEDEQLFSQGHEYKHTSHKAYINEKDVNVLQNIDKLC